MEEERENKREQIRPGKQAVARSAEPNDLEPDSVLAVSCSVFRFAAQGQTPSRYMYMHMQLAALASVAAQQANQLWGIAPGGLHVVLCSAGSALCPLPSDAPVPPATLYSGRRRCGPAKRARPVAVEPVASAGRWSRTNAIHAVVL